MNETTEIFSDIILSYLIKLGIEHKDIEKYTYDTRWYHDLDNWGDDAWDLAVDLQDKGVNMSTFVFSDYFPPEFPDFNFLETVFHGLTFQLFYKDKKTYKTLTLRMIEKVLIAKEWSAVLDIT